MEKQIDFNAKAILNNNNTNNKDDSNTTNKVAISGIRKRRTGQFWKILTEFYLDNSDGGISAQKLAEKYSLTIHYNTILRTIADLKNAGLITLVWRNVGFTHRRKTYKITEKGVAYYEKNG